MINNIDELIKTAKNQYEYDRLIDKYILGINNSNSRRYKKKYGIISATNYKYIQRKEIPILDSQFDNIN